MCHTQTRNYKVMKIKRSELDSELDISSSNSNYCISTCTVAVLWDHWYRDRMGSGVSVSMYVPWTIKEVKIKIENIRTILFACLFYFFICIATLTLFQIISMFFSKFTEWKKY